MGSVEPGLDGEADLVEPRVEPPNTESLTASPTDARVSLPMRTRQPLRLSDSRNSVRPGVGLYLARTGTAASIVPRPIRSVSSWPGPCLGRRGSFPPGAPPPYSYSLPRGAFPPGTPPSHSYSLYLGSTPITPAACSFASFARLRCSARRSFSSFLRCASSSARVAVPVPVPVRVGVSLSSFQPRSVPAVVLGEDWPGGWRAGVGCECVSCGPADCVHHVRRAQGRGDGR